MKYVVLYINCTRGRFEAHGLFDSQASAWSWISKREVPEAYSVFPLQQVTP